MTAALSIVALVLSIVALIASVVQFLITRSDSFSSAKEQRLRDLEVKYAEKAQPAMAQASMCGLVVCNTITGGCMCSIWVPATMLLLASLLGHSSDRDAICVQLDAVKTLHAGDALWNVLQFVPPTTAAGGEDGPDDAPALQHQQQRAAQMELMVKEQAARNAIKGFWNDTLRAMEQVAHACDRDLLTRLTWVAVQCQLVWQAAVHLKCKVEQHDQA